MKGFCCRNIGKAMHKSNSPRVRVRRTIKTKKFASVAPSMFAGEQGSRQQRARRERRRFGSRGRHAGYFNGNFGGKKGRDGPKISSDILFEAGHTPRVLVFLAHSGGTRRSLCLKWRCWHEKMGPSLSSIAGQCGVAGMDFLEEDFRTRTWHVLTSADPGWLTAGFLAAGAGNLLGVVRWAIFLRVLGMRLPAWDVLRLSFVGLFFNISWWALLVATR